MRDLSKILVIYALAGTLFIPQTAAADVRFGIKGGVNVANVNGNVSDQLSDWKSTVGLCAGIFLELNLARVLTIQPEVLYTVKGAEAGIGKLRFDYIEIPVLLKLRIPVGSFHPFVFAGPAFGYNLKAVLDGIKIKDMPRADYGAVLGGGLQMGRAIHIDVRYTKGLRKLAIPDLGTIDLKNGVLSATIGVAF